jgi:DNA gyrase/topoisomerase IV subunit A
MKKLVIVCIILILNFSHTQAADFSNFVNEHKKLQSRLSNLESKITINKNLLASEGADLRAIKKDLLQINKRHKTIYKLLVKEFKISKDSLESIKTRQSSMIIQKNDDQLQSNLSSSYQLAQENNIYLQSIIEDNKAKAFTDSSNSGLYGQVTMITGNCMPQIISKNNVSTCSESAFQTTVVVRSLTKVSELENYTHYSGTAEPLFTVSTNDKGIYKIDLAPGEYSVFILNDSNKEYCDSFDGDGNACKIIINESMQSELNIALDRAAY